MKPRTRVTIEQVGLVVQPTGEEIATYNPARRGELVSELPADTADLADARRRFEVIVDGWRFEGVSEPAARAELRGRAARAAAEHQATAAVTLRAQIPGRVVKVWISEGEVVERGQRLLAIEAMKMENEIRAPHAGTVSGLRVEAGARVERDDELLTIG